MLGFSKKLFIVSSTGRSSNDNDIGGITSSNWDNKSCKIFSDNSAVII